MNWPAERLAVGYRAGARWGTPLDHKWAADGPSWHLRTNGGLLSTVGDLYRFKRALVAGDVLSADSYHKATTTTGSGASYGYGWGIRRTPQGTREIGHNGANGYFFADLRHYPDDGVTLVFATNDHANRSIENDVVAMLFGRAVSEIPAAADARVPLGAYEGRYRTSSGVTFDIRKVGDNLEINRAPSEIVAAFMLPQDPTRSSRPADFDSVVARTLAGMATGDFSLYEKHFMPVGNYTIGGEVEFWTEVLTDWRDAHGQFRGARILGSIEVPGAQAPLLGTYVALDYERGERVIRILQPLSRGEKFFVATVSAAQWPVRHLLVARSATDFLSYNFETRNTASVSVVLQSDGRVRAVVLPNGIRAEKVEAAR